MLVYYLVFASSSKEFYPVPKTTLFFDSDSAFVYELYKIHLNVIGALKPNKPMHIYNKVYEVHARLKITKLLASAYVRLMQTKLIK